MLCSAHGSTGYTQFLTSSARHFRPNRASRDSSATPVPQLHLRTIDINPHFLVMRFAHGCFRSESTGNRRPPNSVHRQPLANSPADLSAFVPAPGRRAIPRFLRSSCAVTPTSGITRCSHLYFLLNQFLSKSHHLIALFPSCSLKAGVHHDR